MEINITAIQDEVNDMVTEYFKIRSGFFVQVAIVDEEAKSNMAKRQLVIQMTQEEVERIVAEHLSLSVDKSVNLKIVDQNEKLREMCDFINFNIKSLISNKEKIKAIKLIRAITLKGLKESKDRVEQNPTLTPDEICGLTMDEVKRLFTKRPF